MNNYNVDEELKHLRAYNTGLTIGILRGIMSGLKGHLTEEQQEMLDNIDKNIHLMFYNHQLKQPVR